MKINYGKVLLIIIVSSVLGLLINYMMPAGIPLIKEKKELSWADDSLFVIKESVEPIEETSELPIEETAPEPSDDVTKMNTEEVKKTEAEIIPDEKQQVKEIAFTEPKAVTLAQALVLYNQGVVFLDARDNYFYREGHIKGAVSLPYYQFEEFEHNLKNISKDQPIVTYCDGTDCDLSVTLANKLFKMGYKRIYIFFDGWDEWKNAGYSIVNETGNQ